MCLLTFGTNFFPGPTPHITLSSGRLFVNISTSSLLTIFNMVPPISSKMQSFRQLILCLVFFLLYSDRLLQPVDGTRRILFSKSSMPQSEPPPPPGAIGHGTLSLLTNSLLLQSNSSTCATSKEGNLHPCTSISSWSEKIIIASGLLICVIFSFIIYCIFRGCFRSRLHALDLENMITRPDAGPPALTIDTDQELSNGFKDGDDKSDGKAENVLLVIHPGEVKLHYIAWPVSSQTTGKEQGYDTETGEEEELATEVEDKSGDVNSREKVVNQSE